ncbi:MAG TPA: ABC transporter permease [Actinomycetes bacterium]|nr:ABC transporter permease [Actinomycetes bacterium]
MTAYVVRRLLASLLILLAASFVMFALVSLSGDPLSEFYASSDPDRELKIESRIDALNLDEPFIVQYFLWLKGAAMCLVPGGGCDLGVNLQNQEVTAVLADAIPTTLRLVLAATVLAIVLGVAIGIISAIRQYSSFDYGITFAAFLFFSLPIFWVAVLLKEFGAIRINDWLAEPAVTLPTAIVIGSFSALFFSALSGGSRKRKVLIGLGAGFAAVAIFIGLVASGWFKNPGMGPGIVIIGSVAGAVGATLLFTNLENRRVLFIAIGTAAIGVAVAYAGYPMLEDPTWLVLVGMGLLVTLVGVGIAYIWGSIDRAAAVRASVVTSFIVGFMVFLDHTISSFASYSDSVNGRPFATIGSNTPNYQGTFWEVTLDTATHLVLPTLAIMLISFAGYSRYSRASMLEVMNADYVRTARAKGLTERTVVLRHAFRNALIPIATLAAIDFGAVIAGAIITETVFGWKGMGVIFTTAVEHFDYYQVMGVFVVTAIAVLVFNLIADISYAILDPRIRLT